VLGIGGGGDVVGALAAARMCELFGAESVLGGVAWERFAIDPSPGPRRMDEIRGGRPIGAHAVVADPGTATSDGVRFAESGMAAHLGAATVLIDINGGPRGAAEGIAAAAEELACDLAVYVDVGGDVLARGDEPGLASPLCDAVMLAAAVRAGDRVPGAGAVFGAGCDGELTPDEVVERIAALGAAGGWIGTWGLTEAVAAEIEAAAREVPTEASLQAVRCFRGETGKAEIRDGRRRVRLTPLGALTFFYDLRLALDGSAPLARAVANADDLEAARDALAALGIRTELDYERERAGATGTERRRSS
jgi:hypothetical protein